MTLLLIVLSSAVILTIAYFTYGPVLSMAAAGGDDKLMRAFIVNGTERMPAFKYYLKPAEINAIIAYLKTVPAPAAPAPDAPKQGEAR